MRPKLRRAYPLLFSSAILVRAGNSVVWEQVTMKEQGMIMILAAGVLLSAGCTGVTRVHKEILVDRGGIDTIGAPADRVQIVLKDATSGERFCKGPGPDTATTASSGISLGVSSLGLPAKEAISDSANRGALDLGGRSPAVLLVREIFYRFCELTLNTNASQETAVSIYKITLDAVERIAASQSGLGSAPSSAAPPPAKPGLPEGLFMSPKVKETSGTSNSNKDDDDEDDDDDDKNTGDGG